MKTQADLTRRVLSIVGVLGSGQVASAGDNALVVEQIGPVIESLAAERIYYFSDSEEIGDAEFEPLARILAETVAPDFGRPTDEAAIDLNKKKLIRLAPAPVSGTRAQPEYF